MAKDKKEIKPSNRKESEAVLDWKFVEPIDPFVEITRREVKEVSDKIRRVFAETAG